MAEHTATPGSPIQNALTIDLEDWYQGLTSTSDQVDRWPDFEDRVVENSDLVLELLDQAQVKATFFVLGYVADQFPFLVRRIADEGHEIGLHSYDHRRVSRLSPEQFREDVIKGISAVEHASGSQVIGYRAPMFSINRTRVWALEILCEMGFRYDSSVFPIRNFFYGFPEAPRFPFQPFSNEPFVEFPLSTMRFLGYNWPVAGGFYLRSFPYWLLKWAIKRIHAEGKPAILYLHPWDLDPEQPRPDPTLREQITHYHNLKTTKGKFIRLLQDFNFVPLAHLLEEGNQFERPASWMSWS